MTLPFPHVFPVAAAINDKDHLVIGGCDAVCLLQEFGSPLYVFDEATLRARCRDFVHEFTRRHHDAGVSYASKAFINIPLAKLFAEEGLGFDVVSGGEVAVLRAAGVAPRDAYFHGNNKSRQELEEAVRWGIGHVVLDNFGEIALLDEVAGRAGVKQPVLLRVSPGIDPHTHQYTTTGVLDSKFGFSVETGDAARAVRLAMKSDHLDVQGLHFHLGSPIFELEPYAAAVRVVLEFAASLREEGFALRVLSPGGGFAIAYRDRDMPPPVAAYAQTIVQAVRSGCHALGLTLPRLVVEPGRAIVGPAGVALYTVGAIKDIPGVRRYVSVDGGMGDNIRPALYGSQYEAVLANRMRDRGAAPVTIAGKYCESGDVLVRDYPMPEPRIGDVVAMPAAGAYAPSMASVYNMNGRPSIVLVKDGRARLIRRRETPEDLTRLDVVGG